MSTITVRLPKSLHAKIKALAQAEGISMNQFLVIAAAEKMAALVTEDYLLRLEVSSQKQLIEKGPGDLITVGDLRHFPVDALIQPSQSDDMDTGVGI